MKVDAEIERATLTRGIPADETFQSWMQAVPAQPDLVYSLSIRIVDEQEARRFNLDYRGRDYATNVLSFPAELPEGLPDEIRKAQLGDLLICAPVVVREAQEQNRPAADHWAHLTVHGILHLLGYDHVEAEDAAVMEALEIDILAGLGIPDPYVDVA
jgi:probable rRNA maturation factor